MLLYSQRRKNPDFFFIGTSGYVNASLRIAVYDLAVQTGIGI